MVLTYPIGSTVGPRRFRHELAHTSSSPFQGTGINCERPPWLATMNTAEHTAQRGDRNRNSSLHCWKEQMTRSIPAALHHTCFLVRDLERAAQQIADALGIGPWNIWTIEPAECKVRGQKSPFSFRVALTTVGGGTYELVTPHNGRSVYDEHIEQHGEGFHHTCLVYPSLEALREAKADLRRQGREPLQEASTGDVFDFAYFPFPEIGSLVEVLYLDVARLPAPEVVIRPSS